MTSGAYYNENDPKAVATLRELIRAGIIAPGDVDERSIEDVKPVELLGYTQCHFFAGAGIWSYAARRAGWDDSRPLWTGSCPCQPFSAAGKGDGFADERHLWPAFFHLIQHAKPEDVPVIGEQVASKNGLTWLDLVQADLEGAGHACWPFDICAAGFGAPIIRQRLFWVAISNRVRLEARRSPIARPESGQSLVDHASVTERMAGSSRGRVGAGLCDSGQTSVGGFGAPARSRALRMGSPIRTGLERHCGDGDRGSEPGWLGAEQAGSAAEAGAVSGMASTDGRRACHGELQRSREQRLIAQESGASGMAVTVGRQLSQTRTREIERVRQSGSCEVDQRERPGPTNGFWRDVDWLYCRDDKWRPVEPGTFVLAHGYPERSGLLRLAGNAINAEVAQAFIESAMEVIS